MNTEIKKVFLSGICGTAMASLAGMLSEAGYSVSGSDQAVYPPMSTFLEGLGIPVTEGFSETNIEKAAPDLVVIGNTLSRGNPEIEYVLDEGLFYKSMAETVKEFFIRGRRSTVVAGTHGKTTTTALLAWLLHSGGLDPSFLVGGIAENFQSSYRIGGGGDFVIEGDEYDAAFFDKGPKFLHYLPDILLIKNIEFDHADIYRDLEAIQLSFRRLINIVPRSGLIVAGIESPAVRALLADAPAPVQTFGLASGDWSADNIHVEGGGTRFDVLRAGHLWHTVWTPLVGEFNVSNALSAVIAAHHLGLSKEAIQVALTGFKNVRRRLEIRGEVSGVTVYDDFAHHPTAVRETLRGVRAQFPDSRVWAVFEPRSQTSRRRIFENEFSDALGIADVALIAPVYSATHLEPDGVLSPERVADRANRDGGQVHAMNSSEEIIDFVAVHARPGDRVVVMSNGGFDDIHRRLLDRLRQESIDGTDTVTMG